MSPIFRHTPHPALVPRDSDSIVPLVFAEIADQCSSALCRGYPPPWHTGVSDLCKLKDADSLRNPKITRLTWTLNLGQQWSGYMMIYVPTH